MNIEQYITAMRSAQLSVGTECSIDICSRTIYKANGPNTSETTKIQKKKYLQTHEWATYARHSCTQGEYDEVFGHHVFFVFSLFLSSASSLITINMLTKFYQFFSCRVAAIETNEKENKTSKYGEYSTNLLMLHWDCRMHSANPPYEWRYFRLLISHE